MTRTFCFWVHIRKVRYLAILVFHACRSTKTGSRHSVLGQPCRPSPQCGGYGEAGHSCPRVGAAPSVVPREAAQSQLRPRNAFRIPSWGCQFAASLPDIRPAPAPVMWLPGCRGHNVALRTTCPFTATLPCHVQNAQCPDSAELPPRPIMALSEQSVMLQPQGGNRCASSAALAGGVLRWGGGWYEPAGLLAFHGREHSNGLCLRVRLSGFVKSGTGTEYRREVLYIVHTPAELMATKEQLFRPFPNGRQSEMPSIWPSNSSSLLASDESVSLPVSGIEVPAGSESSTLFCVDLGRFSGVSSPVCRALRLVPSLGELIRCLSLTSETGPW